MSIRFTPARKHLILAALLSGCGVVFYGLLTRLGFVMPIRELPAALCLPPCAAKAAHHPTRVPTALPGAPLTEQLGTEIDAEKISLLVEKSAHRLTVFYDLQPIKSYPVVFGSAPEGDKFYEGDRKTPEGIYRVRDLYPHPAWSKFIWLDYPNPQSWRGHLQAKLTGQISPLASIGGEIGIHGVPEGQEGLIEKRNNWTWGCVSLKNADVDEIYTVIDQGTVVEIRP
ncbi:MAG: L,D-transpeptidase family protein [Spirulinaceae cyanobacterium]